MHNFCRRFVFLLHLNMITTNTTMSWRSTILHPLSWEDPLSWVILLCWSSITLTTATTMITNMTEAQRWSFTIHPLSLSSAELCSLVAGERNISTDKKIKNEEMFTKTFRECRFMPRKGRCMPRDRVNNCLWISGRCECPC